MHRNKLSQWIIATVLILLSFPLQAQEADNEFTIDAKMLTRGELRYGGFKPDSVDNERMAHFIIGQYRLNFTYKHSSWFEMRLSPQATCVWGQASVNLGLAEAWVSLKSKQGLFAKIGRQILEYDDERILGYDDWTMTAPTHDVLILGYEGHGHKVHALLAYNQNPDNMDIGGTEYSDGLQPYKTMQALWYHYDTPKSIFGFSLLGMNIGMQGIDINTNKTKTYYQQLVGTYMKLQPKIVSLEGAFYYQMGKEEHGFPIDAYMGSVKMNVEPIKMLDFYVGYDYLRGDKYLSVPKPGALGLVFHDKIRGFCPIFGSHHEFYGAMDFFYLDSYVGNFTPGLQNLYGGGIVKPIENLNIDLSYHFFAIATKLSNLKKPLGHELEFSISYKFAKFVQLSAGYSYMKGTETMLALQRVSENRRLHWGWLMLKITPTLFTTTWQKKKKTEKDETAPAIAEPQPAE